MARGVQETACDSAESLANLMVRRFETALIALPKAAFIAFTREQPRGSILRGAAEELCRYGGDDSFISHRRLLEMFADCVDGLSCAGPRSYVSLKALGELIGASSEMSEALKWEYKCTDALFSILAFHKLSVRERPRSLNLRRSDASLLSGMDRDVANEWGQMRNAIQDAEKMLVHRNFNLKMYKQKLNLHRFRFLWFFASPLLQVVEVWSSDSQAGRSK
jgi:hypothetical protein